MNSDNGGRRENEEEEVKQRVPISKENYEFQKKMKKIFKGPHRN